jgi:hypothetical protein
MEQVKKNKEIKCNSSFKKTGSFVIGSCSLAWLIDDQSVPIKGGKGVVLGLCNTNGVRRW